MRIQLDKKKHTRTLIIMYLALIGAPTFFTIMYFQGQFNKFFPFWIFGIVAIQFIPFIMIIRRMHQLKSQTDAIVTLEGGYFTDLTRTFYPLIDIPVDAIKSVSYMHNNKGNLYFTIKLDTQALNFSGLKKLLLRNPRISELVINKLDFEALHSELIKQVKSRNELL